MAGDILVVTEQTPEKFKKHTFEMLGEGRRRADEWGGRVVALVAGGPGMADRVEALGPAGADQVLVAEHEVFSRYNPAALVPLVVEQIGAREPAAVFFAATYLGKDLAPRVGGRLGLGLASDCTGLAIVDGELRAIRPVYASKAYWTLRFRKPPALLSLRPNAFTPIHPQEDRSAEVETLSVELDPASLNYQVREVIETSKGKLDVAEADIIVSGGRGLKGPENFHLIEELAEAIGAATGASRAVVDAGWRPHSEQVGQTGKFVSPTLYVACAISGAVQHLAGMRTSKCIVAINKDPDAPIWNVADYGIVGDAFEILPRLTEAIRNLKDSG